MSRQQAAVGGARLAVADDGGGRARAHRPDVRVVGVEDREAGRRQGLDEPRLLGGDGGPAAELLVVIVAHPGHDGDVRSQEGARLLHPAGCGAADLDHAVAVAPRGAEHRDRHPGEAVGAEHDAVADRAAPREHGGEQRRRGGLAAAAGHRDETDPGPPLAVSARDQAQRIDEDAPPGAAEPPGEGRDREHRAILEAAGRGIKASPARHAIVADAR